MYLENQLSEANDSQGNITKEDHKEWPEWLPHDWCIHQNIGDVGAPSNVFYSNAKGKRFYSKEDVFQYISTHPSHKTNRPTGKAIKSKRISKDKKLPREDTPPSRPNSPPEWPDWLPQDWSIKRSCDDPCVTYYYSPGGKKLFQCKDEVLNHIVAQSTKPKPAQIRRKRKALKTKDDPALTGTRRRKHDKYNNSEFNDTK